MSFFDSIKERLKGATRTAVKASSEFLEVTKINLAIKAEEDKMKALMYDIGKKVYGTYSEGKPVELELSVICDEIVECEENIDKMRQNVMEIKKLKQCGGCSSEVSESDSYCPKCGQKTE